MLQLRPFTPPKAQAARAMWEVVVLVVVLPEYSLFVYFFVLYS